MSNHEHPLWEIADRIQMTVRTLNAQHTEFRSQLAALNLETPAHNCRYCGLRFKSNAKLEEHEYVSHDGPLPAHYAAAEDAAA